VKDKVVYLVISVNESAPIIGLSARIAEESTHLDEVRYITDRLLAVDIYRLGLCLGDGLKRRYLAVVEALCLAKGCEIDRRGRHAVKLGQSGDGGVPHLCPLFRRDVREAGVLYDPAVEKVHDVERRADDGIVFAKTVRFGHRDIGRL